MTPERFASYQATSVADFAQEKVQAGQWSAAESLALSQQAFADLLPQGLATPDQHLFDLLCGDGPDAPVVGLLWWGVQMRAGQRCAFVFDVIVEPGHEGQGHATRAFGRMEDEVRRQGLAGIGLHVFGHNPRARALYERLGFQTSSVQMFKPLVAGPRPATPC